MSRQELPFVTSDISALARSLRRQLAATGQMPGHVELLNMLVRATGHRNFQHFRAAASARERLSQTEEVAQVDHLLVERTARHFDAEGRLIRWPAKPSQAELCLWVLWAGIPADRDFTERDVNEWLNSRHLFGDYALLRRALCSFGLVYRTNDGRVYRRIERQPPADALALIRHVKPRR
jgi:hypothetical protein